jgi:hypothetical protein
MCLNLNSAPCRSHWSLLVSKVYRDWSMLLNNCLSCARVLCLAVARVNPRVTGHIALNECVKTEG